MPLLLKLNNKRVWDKPPWLSADEVPAEALQDFRVEQNELSVWYVEENHSNVDRVLTALAANRNHAEKVDYAICDEAVIAKCNITLRQTPGQLPDEHASREWHRDLIELSGRKLLCLVELIGAGSPHRKSSADVKKLLAEAARNGHIKKELMNEDLAAKLQWPE